MYECTYSCRRAECSVYGETVKRERHPVAYPNDAPSCASCGMPMVLGIFHLVEDKMVAKRKPRFRRSGFNSKQMDLF